MAPVLKILQTGAPVLRQVARPIATEELASARVQQLIEMMRETMRDAPGVGLAAPQIGASIQLVVIEDAPARHAGLSAAQLAERERSAVPFHVLVNPKLVLDPSETVEAFEGCLSFSGYLMVVPRARRARVEALDERGQPIVREASGWYARILQHEIDHLNGVLCCDRMDPRTLTTADQYGREWKDKSIAEVRAALERSDPQTGGNGALG